MKRVAGGQARVIERMPSGTIMVQDEYGKTQIIAQKYIFKPLRPTLDVGDVVTIVSDGWSWYIEEQLA